MLEDGSLTDSALLPSSAVAGHPVTVSAESLMQSISSLPGSAPGHPITFSGGSIMDSGTLYCPCCVSGWYIHCSITFPGHRLLRGSCGAESC